MAVTWEARRRRHELDMEKRLGEQLVQLAEVIGRIVLRAASERDESGLAVVPNTRTAREALRVAVWDEAVKPYFIGPGSEPLIDQEPQSPYMQLIKDGIEGAVRIQVERQVAIIEKHADPVVRDYLLGQRPRSLDIFEYRPVPSLPGEIVISEQGGGDRRLGYDPWHRFVDPNGYRLSDRGWNTALEVRRRIDALLDYHIPLGTAAVDISDLLVPYLWPEAARVTTQTPYGQVGSYWARRLARTEITAAAGRSTVNAAIANPFVEMIDWRLSVRHKCCDICDDYEAGSPYALDSVPQYPAHPHCWCTLVPVVVRELAAVNAQLREQILAPVPSQEVRRLQGAFNLEWMVAALMGGWFLEGVLGRETQFN